jgi:hypothetical protein
MALTPYESFEPNLDGDHVSVGFGSTWCDLWCAMMSDGDAAVHERGAARKAARVSLGAGLGIAGAGAKRITVVDLHEAALEVAAADLGIVRLGEQQRGG